MYNALDERSRQRVRVRVTAQAPDPALIRLQHAAIPRVLDHGRAGRWHFATLEWFDGEPVELPAVGIGGDRPRLRAWATSAMDLLDALEHAHQNAGRAHGDLGLHSLWEGRDGRLRLVDISAPDGPLSPEAVPYASPERLRGVPRDPPSDLYSLGCVLYALAYGTPPFGTDPVHARSGHLLRVAPDAPPGAIPLPALFLAALRTAMDKDPHQRFTTAVRMRAAFSAAIRELDALTAMARAAPPTPATGPGYDEAETIKVRRATLAGPPSPAPPDISDSEVPTVVSRDAPPWLADARRGEAPRRVGARDPAAHPIDDPRTSDHGRAPERDPETDLVPLDEGTLDVPPERVAGPPQPGPGALVFAFFAVMMALVALVVLLVVLLGGVAVWISVPPSPPPMLPPLEAGEGASEAPAGMAPASDPEPAGATDPAAADPATDPAAADPATADPAPAAGDPPSGATVPQPASQVAPVSFPANGYEARPKATFPEFVAVVREWPGAVKLTGHTDSRGPAEVNLTVGLGRAWAVQQLLGVQGVDPSRLPIDSKGETEPIADNATPEGRAMNRRVTAEFMTAPTAD